jgi:hypothetical protein
MKLSRTGVRTLVAMGAVAAGLLLSGRAAQADCGRSAANDARPVYREVEKNRPATFAQSRAADYRLGQYPVVPCPDDASRTRDADYYVFAAWRSALGARDEARFYGETYPDPRCAPIGRARERDQLIVAYGRAFRRVYARVKASPDALHVADLIRREGRSIGLVLPPPWTVDNVQRPVSQDPVTLRAHLPRGVVCGL